MVLIIEVSHILLQNKINKLCINFCASPYHIGETKILGFKDVSWWQGFLHKGQFFLSVLMQPHIWSAKESSEAVEDSLIRAQEEHTVLEVP